MKIIVKSLEKERSLELNKKFQVSTKEIENN